MVVLGPGLAGEPGPAEGYKGKEPSHPLLELNTQSSPFSHKDAMFSKSIFTFLLLLVSLGLFTYANPINDEGLAVRSLLKDVPADMVEHLERRGGWPKKPCRRIRYAL